MYTQTSFPNINIHISRTLTAGDVLGGRETVRGGGTGGNVLHLVGNMCRHVLVIACDDRLVYHLVLFYHFTVFV